jgi:hypothetical protein
LRPAFILNSSFHSSNRVRRDLRAIQDEEDTASSKIRKCLYFISNISLILLKFSWKPLNFSPSQTFHTFYHILTFFKILYFHQIKSTLYLIQIECFSMHFYRNQYSRVENILIKLFNFNILFFHSIRSMLPRT